MRKLMFLIVLLVFVGIPSVFAQTKTITGTVIGKDDGMPIIGVSVSVKGTTIGTITSSNGTYSLNVPTDAKTLVFSFVGMQTVEEAIGDRSTVNVSLESTDISVDEVVIVAYGTSTKKSFTGSATTVKAEKLEKMQVSNVTKALEGAVAGLQTVSASGQPGSSASIRIRGIGSISANQEPLIVVDGVPYEGSLNSISTQDIETMSVLKDAAANSLYGSRGSNGVIMITTKKGLAGGKPRVSIDMRWGVNSRGVQTYDVLTSPQDYYELSWEAIRNNLYSGATTYTQAGYAASNTLMTDLGYNIYKGIPNNQVIDPLTGKLNPNATQQLWDESWLDESFRNGLRQEYNASLSGGADKTQYYFSAGHIADEGYVRNSDFKRTNVRLKIDQTMSDNLKLGGNLAYAKTIGNTPSAGGSNYSNLFMFSQMIAPIYPVYMRDWTTGEILYDNDGNKRYDFGEFDPKDPNSKARPYAGLQNPLSTMQNDIRGFNIDNLSSRAYVDYTFLKDFKLSVNVAYDIFNSQEQAFMTPIGGDAKNVSGRNSKEWGRYEVMNVNQLLNYNKEINDKHNISALVGHETKADTYSLISGDMSNFLDPGNPEFANAASIDDLTSYVNKYKLEAYLSRAEYNYDDKYYLSASFRRDASSKFHPDNRWGNFWSVGASWRLKEENFLTNVDAVDNLKIRASYGTQGNDGIANNAPYLDQFEVTRLDGQIGVDYVFRGNPDLEWEKSTNLNLGLDFELFKFLTFEGDFFIKETTDLLYQKPLPVSGGAPVWIWDNQIDMKNTGFEFNLGMDLINTNDLKWNLSINGMTYKNELTRLPENKDQEKGYVAGAYWRKIGGSLYDWYTYEYVGVDVATGESMWSIEVKDESGNVTGIETTKDYSAASRFETGKSALPKLSGGISTTVDFKGFDFSLSTAYQLGGWTMDSYYQNLMGAGGSAGSNWHKDIFKRWTPGYTNTDVPRLTKSDQNANATSDRFLIESDYFSLRNITLGYSLPSRVLSDIKVETLRFYVVADNIFFLSRRKGLDPRQSFAGTTGYVYSPIRTVSFGVNMKF